MNLLFVMIIWCGLLYNDFFTVNNVYAFCGAHGNAAVEVVIYIFCTLEGVLCLNVVDAGEVHFHDI